jgi:hypothetical protein
MFELPSVHYRGDNLTTLEDTSISLRGFFIIVSSADGGYVYNTTIIADFGILRSVIASAFPAFSTMEVRELNFHQNIVFGNNQAVDVRCANHRNCSRNESACAVSGLNS